MMDKVRQTALVTGAGNGIGRAIAIAMGENGRNVVCADIDFKAAEITAATVRQLGVKATAMKVDVGETQNITDMIDQIKKEYETLDILVNNAGVTRAADIMDVTEGDWDRIHRVNAKGVFFCLQTAAREMIDQGNGGRIINIASIAGRGFAGTSNAAYSASKGAVISLTKTAAQQLAKYDITVNSICPGVTTTEIVEGIVESRANEKGVPAEDIIKEMTDQIPLKRANDPEDIAAMAIFLASIGARNITGQSYNVDGGLITS
jgi:NAD(P)-dependent dehydrogenase (short-subunit alcohol dehydrogenase family)